jgi:SNF2 family DNA or RNA helicase
VDRRVRSEVDLHDYQHRAVEFLCERERAGLFALMGAGKTVTTLTAVSRLLSEMMVKKVLVIAPLRVARTVWPHEPQHWSHLQHLRVVEVLGDQKRRLKALDADADIYSINRENVAWLVEHYGKAWPFDMVVVDESRSFSDHQSKRFKALKAVLKHIRRVVILTGTPAPQGLADLWAQVYLLDDGERLGRTVTAFRSRWFDLNQWTHEWKPKSHAQREIEEKISDIVQVVESYDGLPSGTRNVIECPLDAAAFEKYEEFERERVIELAGAEITPANAAVLAGKLLQFAAGALYDDDRNVHELHTSKLDALADLVESLGGEPLLVAYWFQHDLDRLKQRFPKARVLDKSQRVVDDWNNGKIPLLFAHPASAGHGLNLQRGGCNVCWFSLTWSLELYQQFNARLVRQGQGRPVILHHLVVPGTIDEVVLKALDGKADGQARLIAAVKELVAARSTAC